MSQTTTITDQRQTEAESETEQFDAGAFEKVESTLGVDSGDDLADEIESLLNETSNNAGSTDQAPTAASADPTGDQDQGPPAEQPFRATAEHAPQASDPYSQSDSQSDEVADDPSSEGFHTTSEQEGRDTAIPDDPPTEHAQSSDGHIDVESAAEPTSSVSEATTEAPPRNEPPSVSESAPNAAGSNLANEPEQTPTVPRTNALVGQIESALRHTCFMMNAPLAGLSPEMRTIVGYAALATILNAAAIFAYALLT